MATPIALADLDATLADLYGSQNWGSGFGLSDEKNNRIASSNALYIDTGLDTNALREQAMQIMEDANREADKAYQYYANYEDGDVYAQEYIDGVMRAAQNEVNKLFPSSEVFQTEARREPSNTKFYDEYQYITDPYNENFGNLKYVRERERNWEGISGGQLANLALTLATLIPSPVQGVAQALNIGRSAGSLATGDGSFGDLLDVIAPVSTGGFADLVGVAQDVDTAVQAIEDDNYLGALFPFYGDELTDMVLSGIDNTALGDYIDRNNLGDAVDAGVSRTLEEVAGGKDLDEAALRGLASYVGEGGGIGGEAENAVINAIVGLGDVVAPVVEPVLGAISKAGSAVDDSLLQPIIGSLSQAGSAIDDSILQPTIKALSDIGSAVDDTLLQPVIQPISQAGSAFDDAVIQPIVQAGSAFDDAVIQPLIQAGSAIDDSILQPTIKALSDIGSGIDDAVIQPIVQAGSAIDDAVIQPIVQAGSTVEDIVSEAIPSTSLPELSGPDLPDISGPDLPDISGPDLPDISGPDLPNIEGPNMDWGALFGSTANNIPQNRVVTVGSGGDNAADIDYIYDFESIFGNPANATNFDYAGLDNISDLLYKQREDR